MLQHDTFPNVWGLAAGPDPNLLKGYLHWLTSDEKRFEDAIRSMQWLPVGFNALTIAAKKDPKSGIVSESLQLNFYHQDYPGNDHPHGHSRWARSSWYAHPDTRQRITRHFLLPEGAVPIPGLPLTERQVVANSIIDKRDGRRPDYSPIQLGSRLILEQSVTQVAPLGSQTFSSLEVHNVAFEGLGVAISVHYKRAEEPAGLSGLNGLVAYKGLTTEQAEIVLESRRSIGRSLLGEGASRQGPITMVFPDLEFDLAEMQATPTSTPLSLGERLIIGGMTTIYRLAA